MWPETASGSMSSSLTANRQPAFLCTWPRRENAGSSTPPDITPCKSPQRSDRVKLTVASKMQVGSSPAPQTTCPSSAIDLMIRKSLRLSTCDKVPSDFAVETRAVPAKWARRRSPSAFLPSRFPGTKNPSQPSPRARLRALGHIKNRGRKPNHSAVQQTHTRAWPFQPV